MRTIRFIAVAAMLPLLLLEGGTASALYRCLHDGVARTTCCCPSDASSSKAPPAALTEACCCKIERSSPAPRQAQARLESTSTSWPSAPVAILVPLVSLDHPNAAISTALSRAGLDPPYARPPLILLKRSLLI